MAGSAIADWPRSALLLALGGLVTGIVLTAGIALLSMNLRAHALDNQKSELATQALMLSGQADSAFQALESVQTGLIDQMRSLYITTEERYAALMTTPEIYRALKDRVSALPFVNAVTLIDRHGKLLNFSRYWPIPDVNVSDRDYFKALTSEGRSDRFVSEPVQNRGTGTWTVYLARRFDAPDGSFLGMVLGAIDLGYFEHYFTEAVPAKDAVVSMFRSDGVMLMRHPAADYAIGLTAAAQILKGGSDRWEIRHLSPVDGQDRLVAIHRLAHYPIMLSMSRTVAATLQPWREQARYFAALVVLIDVGLVGLVLLGIRHLRSRHLLARAEALRAAAKERERNGQALAAYSARFDTAVNNMSQGLCMFDAEDRLIVSNPRLAEIFGLPAQALAAGTLIAVVMYAAVRNRTISAVDIRLLTTRLGSATSSPSRAALVWDLTDGRALSVTFDPIAEQGWLMTFEDLTERRRTEAQIVHMAHHDALTGLANRHKMTERLNATLARSRRDGSTIAVLLLDLDRFKPVNDVRGHAAGDRLLQMVAERLPMVLRETDIVARFGGDEFVLAAQFGPGIADSAFAEESDDPVDSVARLARQLVAALVEPFDLGDASVPVLVSASVGVALTQGGEATAEELLRRADIAMYRAKAEGRSCFRFFEPDMDAHVRRRAELEMDLRQAIAADELVPHYQPLVALDAGDRLIGFEMLARWLHPKRGMVVPAEFIPLAEETGLIVPMTEQLLCRACRAARAWPDHLILSVNVSPVQLRDRALPGMVAEALAASGLPPHRLEIELTETALVDNFELARELLTELKELGVRLALDDFGTGHSSLRHLQMLSFDKIKIDGSFVKNMIGSPHSGKIVAAVVGLGHSLGLLTVAEGVEDAATASALRNMGCDIGQGWLFGQPVSEAEAGVLARGGVVGLPLHTFSDQRLHW